MALFGRKKIESGVEEFEQGVLLCHECGKEIEFSGLQPLSMTQCPHCEHGYNFIPLRIADFWLFRPLGGGGMGSVYEALIVGDPERHAAVKILPRDKKDDPILLAGLQAEIEIMQALGQHPNIVSIIDAGFDGTEYYLGMDFIKGERLDKRIHRLGRLSEMEVLTIGLQILSGETHIYNQGYLFRDMKPENVIIDEHGAHLFDYGICIRVEEAYEDLGDVVSGSPIYWPPERVMGEVEMPRSEIYSIGMVMFHALKGEPFFQAKELDAMARKHVRKVRVQNYEEKLKGIEPDLATVILKMIARDPEKRYQTFAEVEYELTRILEKRIHSRLTENGT